MSGSCPLKSAPSCGGSRIWTPSNGTSIGSAVFAQFTQARREGREGEVSPGPATFEGAPTSLKIIFFRIRFVYSTAKLIVQIVGLKCMTPGPDVALDGPELTRVPNTHTDRHRQCPTYVARSRMPASMTECRRCCLIIPGDI